MYQYGQQYNRNGNLDWIMVATIADAEKVTVQPGQKAWIMVQNEPVFALRTADNMGLVHTELYKFERYIPKQNPDLDRNYVTKDELEKVVEELKNMIGGASHESAN